VKFIEATGRVVCIMRPEVSAMCLSCFATAVWGLGAFVVGVKLGMWPLLIYLFLSLLAGWRLLEWIAEND